MTLRACTSDVRRDLLVIAACVSAKIPGRHGENVLKCSALPHLIGASGASVAEPPDVSPRSRISVVLVGIRHRIPKRCEAAEKLRRRRALFLGEQIKVCGREFQTPHRCGLRENRPPCRQLGPPQSHRQPRRQSIAQADLKLGARHRLAQSGDHDQPARGNDGVDGGTQLALDRRPPAEMIEVFDDQHPQPAHLLPPRGEPLLRLRGLQLPAKIGGGEIGERVGVELRAHTRTSPCATCDFPLPAGPTITSGLKLAAASARSPPASSRSSGGASSPFSGPTTSGAAAPAGAPPGVKNQIAKRRQSRDPSSCAMSLRGPPRSPLCDLRRDPSADLGVTERLVASEKSEPVIYRICRANGSRQRQKRARLFAS